jgi:hypothetical protein
VEPTAEQRAQVPEHVMTRVVDEQLVLLNLDNEEFYGLDEVGTAIWFAVTDAPTIAAAMPRLLEQFDVDADILAEDTRTLLQELESRGLVAFAPA